MNQLNLKNLFKVALISSAIVSMGSAHAAQSSTAAGTASANVITPILISAGANLVFGDLTAGGGGTVAIDLAGLPTHGGGVLEVPGGTFSAATFFLTGGSEESYAVTLPVSATLSGPGDDMIVDAFDSDATGTLDTSGLETFNVGATLNVGLGQIPGEYAGTFDVTVEYN